MKYQNIIENMPLKEKAAFLSGKSEWQTREFPRLDIPAIFCSDGPNGVRKQPWQTAGMKNWSRR